MRKMNDSFCLWEQWNTDCKMGHIKSLTWSCHFQKKLGYILWMWKYRCCLLYWEDDISLRTIFLALQGSTASSSREPCPHTFSKVSAISAKFWAGSMAVRSVNSWRKICASHFKSSTLGSTLFQLILYAFRPCITISAVIKIMQTVTAFPFSIE
jgi:hypothetical protein